MRMKDKQKGPDQETTKHMQQYLPKAIFVLKDLIKNGNTNTKLQEIDI